MIRFVPVMVAMGFVLVAGCATGPHDYGVFLEHMPKSILVLPPLNRSTEVLASNAFLSTVTRPLARSGYYVFPVAVVDAMMKENGLPTAGEMHQVPLEKLAEVFGADAVLYVVIMDWRQQYLVVSSKTTVTIEYRLVDLHSGKLLWHTTQTASNGQGGLSISGVIEAAVHAAISAATDQARDLAARANTAAFGDGRRGLLLGRRHPGFNEDQKQRRQQQEQLEQAKPQTRS